MTKTAYLQSRQDWIRSRREKRKLARKARTRRQISRYCLLTLLLATAVCGITVLDWRVSDVRYNVEIHGNRVVRAVQVYNALAPFTTKPLHRLNPKVLEQAVAALPEVRYAFVRRYLFPRPHLVVQILEEFPWATLCATPNGPPLGVIAQTGKYIPIADFPNVVEPALRICGTPGLKLTDKQIISWDKWVNLTGTQTGKPVTMIDMRKPMSIEMISGDLQLHVGAADSSMERRLSRLASLMPVLPTLKGKLQFIDLSLDSNIPIKILKGGDKDAGHLLVGDAEAHAQTDGALPARAGQSAADAVKQEVGATSLSPPVE